MPTLPSSPPAAVALAAHQLPPLSFAGFRARMPVAEARAIIVAAGGYLDCVPTSDSRLRECTGTMPVGKPAAPFRILISSVHDSAAVIVLSGAPKEQDSQRWMKDLAGEFGAPNLERQPGVGGSWQWIKRGQMLRVTWRRGEGGTGTAITLTDGPLLDGLDSAATKRPN